MGIKVKGTKKISKNMARASQRITAGSVKGLKKVGMVVQRAVGWSGGEPLIPVRTGNLRNSWFTIPYTPRGDRARAIRFGYRAKYAEYQHDPQRFTNTWPRWRYTRDGSGPNYLRSTINEMTGGFRSGNSSSNTSIKGIIERNIKKEIGRRL